MKKLLLTFLIVLNTVTPCMAMELETEANITEEAQKTTETEDIAESMTPERDFDALDNNIYVETEDSVYETFKQREEAWNHDYKMLNRGVFNCDYVDNYNNETKEPIDSSLCGTQTILLQSELPSEPQKIFLQVYNLDEKLKFGGIALREQDNCTYVFKLKLFPGTYMIDYIIAEGDAEGDFWVEPEVFDISLNANEVSYVELKRQSNISVGDTMIYPEDLEKQIIDSESESIDNAYDPSANIMVPETTEEAVEEIAESKNPEMLTHILLACFATVICIVGIFLFRRKKNR